MVTLPTGKRARCSFITEFRYLTAAAVTASGAATIIARRN